MHKISQRTVLFSLALFGIGASTPASAAPNPPGADNQTVLEDTLPASLVEGLRVLDGDLQTEQEEPDDYAERALAMARLYPVDSPNRLYWEAHAATATVGTSSADPQ